MMLVYCDTNIIVDYAQGRSNRFRPLDSFAFDFFSRGWNCAYKLVISDWVMEEALKHADKKDIDGLLDNFREKDKLIQVNKTDEDIKEAKKMSDNWTDALHVVLALKGKADKLATRNVTHFFEFSSKIDISFPESI